MELTIEPGKPVAAAKLADLPIAPEGKRWRLCRNAETGQLIAGTWELVNAPVRSDAPLSDALRKGMDGASTEQLAERAIYRGVQTAPGLAAVLGIELAEADAIYNGLREQWKKPMPRSERNVQMRILAGSANELLAKCWTVLEDPKVSERGKQAAYTTAKSCLEFIAKIHGLEGDHTEVAQYTMLFQVILQGLTDIMQSTSDNAILGRVGGLLTRLQSAQIEDAEGKVIGQLPARAS